MGDHADIIDLLPLFAGCSRQERELVIRLSTVTDAPRGAALCIAGQSAPNFYVLVSGEAAVTVDERRVAVLGPGCGFGEIALLRPGGRRTATVTATTDVQLLLLARTEFLVLMSELPQFARQVRAESRRRLTAADEPPGTWAVA